jgi:hypothetical protein
MRKVRRMILGVINQIEEDPDDTDYIIFELEDIIEYIDNL